jgi:hypothetical protein
VRKDIADNKALAQRYVGVRGAASGTSRHSEATTASLLALFSFAIGSLESTIWDTKWVRFDYCLRRWPAR